MQLFKKKVIALFGSLIGGISIAFIAFTVYKYSTQMGSVLHDKKIIGIVFLCSLFYAGILQLVAIAWFFLLRSAGNLSIGLLTSIEIFSSTQVYKYLPSNVFHFVGRFAIAIRRGASLASLSYAQAMEIILMILSSAMVALVFTLGFIFQLGQQYGLSSFGVLLVFAVGNIIALIGSPIFASIYFFKAVRFYTLTGAILAFIFYTFFFLANGSMVSGLAGYIYCKSIDLQSILGITAASWLVGFVVPGAPGGLGVREAVFITGLSAIGVPVPTATVLALLHRLVTVLGDMILFGLGRALKRVG